MRITLVINTFNSGGAERVLSTMANYWANKGWDITLLFTHSMNHVEMFYDLHPAIKARVCGQNGEGPPQEPYKKINKPKRIYFLRQAIKQSKPQVIISFLDHVNIVTLIASFGLRIPVIVSERNYPYFSSLSLKWRLLRGWLYPRASCVVGITQPIVSYISKYSSIRSRVIPNPVLIPSQRIKRCTDQNSNQPEKTVMAMGRLVEQKGFDILIKAFAQIHKQHPNWSLDIWGKGELQLPLEKLRDDLGLTKSIRFPGRTKQSHNEMMKADLFVLSSEHEGFPNVLGEAMACGLPVISFDCPTGPSVLIRDGIDGLLIPPLDENSLANAMDRLMGDPAERERLSKRAPEVTDRFGLEKIMSIWEELIFDLIKK